jgi:hypothetical protein
MPRNEKEFDAVELMRALRDEIDRDVASMTPAQRREYIRHRADRVRGELGLGSSPEPAVPLRRAS